jgi:hypothetical protein
VLYRDKLQGPAARRFLQKAVNLLTTVWVRTSENSAS